MKNIPKIKRRKCSSLLGHTMVLCRHMAAPQGMCMLISQILVLPPSATERTALLEAQPEIRASEPDVDRIRHVLAGMVLLVETLQPMSDMPPHGGSRTFLTPSLWYMHLAFMQYPAGLHQHVNRAAMWRHVAAHAHLSSRQSVSFK